MMSQGRKLTAVPSPRAFMDTATTDKKVGWRDRLHDPALTALLLIESLLTFVLVPLREIGIAGPPFITFALPLLLIAIVVLLSRTKGAVLLVLVSTVLCIGGMLLYLVHHSLATNVISTGGVLLARVALGWVIAAAVFAPGRITHYRIQGAIVLYINFGVAFAVLYRLIVQLSPGAITGLPAFSGDLGPMAELVYFSFATLTTSGYGDILPVHPFARSLANLEAVVGALYPATLLARIVTLEIGHRKSAVELRDTRGSLL